MGRIELTTTIHAPVARVFDLSRSIDLHVTSTRQTEERAVAGVTTGLIGLNEEVTWQARHFGLQWSLTSRITVFRRPDHFRDTMVRGIFRRFDHDHFFREAAGSTLMKDVFALEAPFGPMGDFVERLFVISHLRGLLSIRNQVIKSVAESDDWKKYLPQSD